MGWWLRKERAPLYERVYDINLLTRAWQHVRRGGGAGVDGLTVKAFEARWAENMAELAAELRERRYHPLPLRQYLLPRPEGGQRPISLLALRDRVVQRAVLEVVQPSFERAASPAAFGALPGRGVGEALARAEQARRAGLNWIVRSDIRAFFEEIDHRRVVASFLAVAGDDVIASLVEEWLAVGVLEPPTRPSAPPLPARLPGPDDFPTIQLPSTSMLVARLRSGLEVAQSLQAELARLDYARPVAIGLAGWLGANLARWRPHASQAAPALLGMGALALAAGGVAAARRLAAAEPAAALARGTPQGSPLSPLLATGALRPLDQALDRPEQTLVRYVDDLLLVCRDEGRARRGLEDTRRQVYRLGLVLNEAKTCLQPYDAGFTFLGATLPQLPALEEPGATVRALAAAFRASGYWRARRLAGGRRPATVGSRQ
ncbi:MAG: hypothetical protein HY690_06450 [Chloroflexi bacterium]|nr:hypothetical protein [Chloroflexota bacterium]